MKSLLRRHYDYLLRFEFRGAGTGLVSARVFHTIQHSQRPLPALDIGDNQIQFSAGPDEGTMTIEGSVYRSPRLNLLYSDFHPQMNGLSDGPLAVVGKSGEIAFPIATPGELKRLRLGTLYRARGAGDGWDYQVSLDGGSSWITVDRVNGPTAGDSHYIVYDQIPSGIRQALVRFAGRQTNTARIYDLRIDADFLEPHGGFRPVKITYAWTEGGNARTDVHIATQASERYRIHCDGKPLMCSLTVELAD